MSTYRPHQPPQTVPDHHLEWNDRLQDWLDGETESADSGVFENHLAACDICQLRVTELQQLESALIAESPLPQLSASFDTQLFAQIDSVNETQRAAARQRVEQELQQNLKALSLSWRRTLVFVIPGIVAGVALAFGLTGYFEASGITATLAAEGASKLGANASQIQMMLTALLGAGLGGAMAGWLSRVAE